MDKWQKELRDLVATHKGELSAEIKTLLERYGLKGTTIIDVTLVSFDSKEKAHA